MAIEFNPPLSAGFHRGPESGRRSNARGAQASTRLNLQEAALGGSAAEPLSAKNANMLPTGVVGVNLRPTVARGRPQEKTLQKAHLAALTYAQILCHGPAANAREKTTLQGRSIGRTSSKTVDFIGFWSLLFFRAIQTSP
jgi:hypothetical protein